MFGYVKNVSGGEGSGLTVLEGRKFIGGGSLVFQQEEQMEKQKHRANLYFLSCALTQESL